MLVLSISTSTPTASVALVEGDHVLAELSRDDQRGHAEHLFGLIDAAFERAGRARADVELVACDVGPGSFTGVRIAVASAKGIAVGLGVPLAGVVSLEAMAAHARALAQGDAALSALEDRALALALIDAKKGELYASVYDGDAELMPPCHIAAADVPSRVAEIVARRPFISVADVSAFADLVPGARRSLVLCPSAAWIGRIAAARGGADAAEIVPMYVRAPDAVPSASNSAAAPAFDMLPHR